MRKLTTAQIVDRVLAGNSNPTWGGAPYEPRPPASDDAIALIKRQINVQLDEYEQALRDYAAWLSAWRARQPKGFRCKRTGTTT